MTVGIQHLSGDHATHMSKTKDAGSMLPGSELWREGALADAAADGDAAAAAAAAAADEDDDGEGDGDASALPYKYSKKACARTPCSRCAS